MQTEHFGRRIRSWWFALAALVFAGSAPADEPELLSIYAPGGLYYETQLVGDILYIAGADFFHVVDVSDPTEPTELAIRSVEFAAGVEVVGDRAYLAQYTDPKLRVMGIANPASPTYIASLSIPSIGYGYSLDVGGDFVYMISDPGGLRIIDVSALPTLVEVASFDPPATSLLSVAVYGDHAYVAGSVDGVFVLDVSDPTSPVHVDTIVGAAGSVEVEGAHLYVAGTTFRIFDISNSGSPFLVGEAPIAAGRLRVDEAQGLAYGGGTVIDISDLANPTLVASISIPDPFAGIWASDGADGVVYISELLLGVHIYRVLPGPPLPPPTPTVVPVLGGLVAIPLGLVGWRLLQRSRRSNAG